jgi:hypothetical protein
MNLKYLYLHQNELINSMPAEMGNMVELIDLYLNNNSLSGPIPPEIGKLINLQKVRLQNNQLFGQIPDSLCNLDLDWSNSINFNISNNNLCEPYPYCVENNIGTQDTSNCSDLSLHRNFQVSSFKLSKPFPNPFNSSIKIEFELSFTDQVKINIYNINGRKVKALLNRWMVEGIHSVRWEAQNQSSGLYFINMQARGRTASKKVLLIN